jgi:glycine cleavage system P protein (glycine dehydrogenase) subunit 1
MLTALGMASVDELFAHLPPDVRLNRPLDIPAGQSEYEIIDYFRGLGDQAANGYASFLGAGVYRHFRPVVIDALATRGEFLTSYTPYQAEISQGVLTTIFEFQTMIAQLTGMELANASMYDGSTAVPEAAMMAIRITGRDKLLVARSLHPEYREVLDTYRRHQDIPTETISFDRRSGQIDLADLEAKLKSDVAAVIVQSPNFFGVVDSTRQAAELAHRHGALLVVVFTEAVSLGLLEPAYEADIIAGELQSFAHPPSYGGPFVGVLATKQKYIRQIPGRLVGETVDTEGNRAFCLTLATREQHIRRAKATSNICTNQALIALMATIYMTVFGKEGLRELAEQNLAKAHYLAGQIEKQGAKLAFQGPYFNEFVVAPNGVSASVVNERALADKIIGGLDLGRFYPELRGSMLVCATEMNRRDEMDRFASVFAP